MPPPIAEAQESSVTGEMKEELEKIEKEVKVVESKPQKKTELKKLTYHEVLHGYAKDDPVPKPKNLKTFKEEKEKKKREKKAKSKGKKKPKSSKKDETD
jgi:hypothetical protein